MDFKINFKEKENINIIFTKCPRCGENFNQLNKKRTKSHTIPLFLGSKMNIIHSLCLECHTELNSYYKMQKIQFRNSKKVSKSFNEFKNNYEQLREDFHDKKINRGQFGEGLWSNLISYLENKEELKNMELGK